MYDLGRHTSLWIAGDKLTSYFSSSTDITSKLGEWDLNMLSSIVTSDTLKDNEKRKKAAYKTDMIANSVAGAAVGALIDAASGEDSIIEGLLIGAAFGAIATGSPKEPKAKIGLLFTDNSYLSLSVDADEYAQLQTKLTANLMKPDNGYPETEAYRERPLTQCEANQIIDMRRSKRATHETGMGLLTLVAPAGAILVIGTMTGDFNVELPMPSGTNIDLWPIMKMMGIIGGGFAIVMAMVSMNRNKNAAYMSTAEQVFYEANY